MIWLLIGYMYLFIHRPFEIWDWLAVLRVERVFMLITLAYWALVAKKSWTSNRLNLGVALFTLSFCLSTAFSQYVGFSNLGVQDWLKLLVFYFLVITSVNRPQDLKLLIIAFVVIAGIYELHSLREFFNGRRVYRMGTWRMVAVTRTLSDPNSFAATTNTFIPMLLPLTLFAKQRWQKLALLGLLALFLLTIFLTGSRSGLIALIALVVGVILCTKHRWKILPVIILLPILLWGFLPEDLQQRYRTIIDPSSGPANAKQSADSRVEFFWAATKIWNREPIFGVGPNAFKTASGIGKAPHSLYAQTISDFGTLGVIALGILLLCFATNFFQARNTFKPVSDDQWARFHYFVVIASTVGILQLLVLGFAGHNLLRFTWIWYAAFAAAGMKFLQERRNDLDQSDASPETTPAEIAATQKKDSQRE